MRFLVHWAIVAAALWVATAVVSGVTVGSVEALLVAALVLGLVNALVRPILTILTLPITINFLSAGMAVARLIQGGAADVGLEATMKSGEAEVPIGLSQTVRFERDKF